MLHSQRFSHFIVFEIALLLDFPFSPNFICMLCSFRGWICVFVREILAKQLPQHEQHSIDITINILIACNEILPFSKSNFRYIFNTLLSVWALKICHCAKYNCLVSDFSHSRLRLCVENILRNKMHTQNIYININPKSQCCDLTRKWHFNIVYQIGTIKQLCFQWVWIGSVVVSSFFFSLSPVPYHNFVWMHC